MSLAHFLTLTLLSFVAKNGDYPFKFGTYMGCDAAGNRYYENRVDYPFGQHRWVEPGDIHNFDSSSISPEWQVWMTSVYDEPPSQDEELIERQTKQIQKMCRSDAPAKNNVGHQEEYVNFHNMHNQSQIRSRGYGIGNPVVGLPPHVPDAYYTQPGSPYNDASIRKTDMIGDLGGGRPYKSEKWADRLRTPEEKAEIERQNELKSAEMMEEAKKKLSGRMAALRSRGAGTVVGE